MLILLALGSDMFQVHEITIKYIDDVKKEGDSTAAKKKLGNACVTDVTFLFGIFERG